MSSIVSSSHLVNGTQATPDEYKRIDKWRCCVADECVAELEKLSVSDRKSTRSRTSKAGSIKDDSLVVYDPKAREEVFEKYDQNGRPIKIIRRYKSVKETATRKSDPHVVQVTVEQSSSRSSDHSYQPRRTEHVHSTRRARERKSTYRDDAAGQSDDSRERRYTPTGSRHRKKSHSREKSEAMSNRRSEQVSSSKKDVLRRILKLHDSDVVSSQREDSVHSRSRNDRPTESRSRARSFDGRNIYTRRIPRDDASVRSGRPGSRLDSLYGGQPYYYDLRDARRQESQYDSREQDRRSTYSMPRRSKTVNRSQHISRRSYDRRSTRDDAYIDDELDKIHRRVEQFQAHPISSTYSYEPTRRSRRRSTYDDYYYD